MSTAASAQFHEGDIGVARTASGKLQAFNVPSLPVTLPPVSGLLDGFSDNDPGFDVLEADQPGNDLFTLQTGAQVRLRATAIDPAFKVWRPNLSSRIDAPGEEIPLGDHLLHEHPVWHIDSEDTFYSEGQAVWEATFVLVDAGTTGYATSDPFVLRFANRAIPTVSEWGLAMLALGLLAAGTLVTTRRQSGSTAAVFAVSRPR